MTRKFNLQELEAVVQSHFNKPCKLEKLAEGGYHKVYDITSKGNSLQAVVRVAAPAFPVYKLASEVATILYIASKTKVPVPKIHLWNSNAENAVGAEYLVMEKIKGVSADSVWETLDLKKKVRTVTDLAKHLHALFRCRFYAAGSLYTIGTPPDYKFMVGLIVATPFYRALDGCVRVSEWESYSQEIERYRGPFRNVTEYLQSPLLAELRFISRYPDIALEEAGDEDNLELGKLVLEKTLDLCTVFPGDQPVHTPVTTPELPFSIKLDDFRLSNVLIDEMTGRVTGMIDFEGATIAPLWACACMPPWIRPLDDPESSHEGGDDKIREDLRDAFVEAMGKLNSTGEWMSAYQTGRPYRRLVAALGDQVLVWSESEEWVDKRLKWKKEGCAAQYDDAQDTVIFEQSPATAD
ncbi:hypothetical protein BDV93DRAFT_497071 [Ceratobasidium sp. AG-I]|nr:hypothetical protein BDV93DRAFT_497071 [Ceratobasidium sp. AG-I]